MTIEALTSIPATVRSGDSISWLLSFAGYPATAGWSLSITLINHEGKETLTGTASGDSYAVTVPAATTAGWDVGVYAWAALLTSGTDRVTAGTGQIEVLANLAALTTHDRRTHAEICLANLEAVIQGKATADNLEYAINDRSLKRYTWSELLSARAHFKAEVAREQRAASGKTSSGRVAVRFS